MAKKYLLSYLHQNGSSNQEAGCTITKSKNMKNLSLFTKTFHEIRDNQLKVTWIPLEKLIETLYLDFKHDDLEEAKGILQRIPIEETAKYDETPPEETEIKL